MISRFIHRLQDVGLLLSIIEEYTGMQRMTSITPNPPPDYLLPSQSYPVL